MSSGGRTVMGRHGIRRLFAALAVLAALGSACGFDSREQKVYDDGGLLTEAEETRLQELLVETADRVEQDLVIVITGEKKPGITPMIFMTGMASATRRSMAPAFCS